MAYPRVSSVLVLPLLFLAITNAARVYDGVTILAEGVDAMHDSRYMATMVENKVLTSVVGDTYCCLKNGYGCMQNCDSSKNYSCCLKNGYGCMWMCENGVEHYCCEKNGYGCTKMCPKSTLTSGNL
ncbi:hypothetical protein SELMODRAFT_442072 [Selaginella moellendorffii]|uniref:Granulins domain-containing protein n=1 Tax=Selaginella moellendorffii TaxID=88036 RepID=D8RQ08_SELML|nr:uncharacterized protein LOC9637950 [Selaginella moellendorffii]EFJ25774.1 hypothetical protein SELMODRAFT_442072 [Selaginella moellendorffii]|eukprot:XP_002973400.1 uncharacterized protein LOC9637950 [Selaginella moellendorffii]